MGVLETAARIVQLGGATERLARVAEMRARLRGAHGGLRAGRPMVRGAEPRLLVRRRDDGTVRTRGGGGALRGRAARSGAARAGAPGPLSRGRWRRRGRTGRRRARRRVERGRAGVHGHGRGVARRARRVGGAALRRARRRHRRPVRGGPAARRGLPPARRDGSHPGVLAAARARSLPTGDTLDALLRMERTLRSLSRVKAAYAYRPEALSPHGPALPTRTVRRSTKAPT